MKMLRLAVLLICLLLPVCAAYAGALDTLYLSVTACDGTEMPAASAEWYRHSGKTYLLLPGGTDWSATRVWYKGSAASITVNGEERRSGDLLTGLSSGMTLEITCGKKTYKVNVMSGSSIGALFISSESGSMSKVDKSKYYKEAGSLTLLQPDGRIGYDGPLEHLKLRGNTSSVLPKKNYSIKLAESTDLLGMGKAKRWVLMGSYRDKTQLRNQIVYDMARYVGLPYTPDLQQVDLYFNHAYHGTYLLTEKIEVGKRRVNIRDLDKANKEVNELPLDQYAKLGYEKALKGKYKAYALPNNPEDITGGYIIEYENMTDRYHSEACAYRTTRGKVLLVKAPEIVSEAEMKYISGFMQGYENAIFAENGIDPKSGKRYDEFVDFNSLVLKYMLEEVSMNCDGNASSQYYVKPSDSESTVAFAGPAWDYDTTFGDYATTASASRLLNPNLLIHGTVTGGSYWWPRLYRRTEFKQAVKEAWTARYSVAMQILMGETTDLLGRLRSVDDYAAESAASVAMNTVRWPIPRRTGASVNQADTGNTYQSNMEYLKNFIAKRYAYLQRVWGQ